MLSILLTAAEIENVFVLGLGETACILPHRASQHLGSSKFTKLAQPKIEKAGTAGKVTRWDMYSSQLLFCSHDIKLEWNFEELGNIDEMDWWEESRLRNVEDDYVFSCCWA